MLVGRGLLAEVAGQLPARLAGRRAIVISDTTVAGLHAGPLLASLRSAGYEARLLEVAPGEGSKTLAQAERLYAALAAEHANRSTPVLALGGGVVSDLAGFVAATWMRGLPFVPLPTTVEADLDACLGGKTAVNHPAGKNLIGAFHQPSLVVIDIDCLATLPDRDFAAGLAESVKHGMIRDRGLVDWQLAHSRQIRQRDPETLEALVERNCAIKAAIVAADEREAGPRMILNFGHTIGHALEAELGYDLRHGECVALGMLAAGLVATARGGFAAADHDRMRSLLEAFNLPTRLPRRLDAAAVLKRLGHDKKVRGGELNFVLPTGIGEAHIVRDVQDHQIMQAIDALQPPSGADE